MEYNFLKIADEGNICILTISAPKTLNALNSAILKEMDDFLTHFDCNKYRCLIITGDGEKSFVAGADISEMANLNMLQGQTFGSRVLGPERPMVARVQNLYIRQVVMKIETQASMTKVKALLRQLYEQMLELDSRMKSVRLYYDVDPV